MSQQSVQCTVPLQVSPPLITPYAKYHGLGLYKGYMDRDDLSTRAYVATKYHLIQHPHPMRQT